MPMNKSTGNMYPWVDFTKNWIGGKCPHECSYCLTEALKKKWPTLKKRYSGKLFLIEKELQENLYRYGEGLTGFAQNLGDLFADEIPREWILRVFEHCKKYPNNIYLFQTKNPFRFMGLKGYFPLNTILGTTIETNRDTSKISKAPTTQERAKVMACLRQDGFTTMVSIEPILDFDLDELLRMIADIGPKFVSIGADSKNNKLEEPTKDKVEKLIEQLEKFTEVKRKDNLKRLTGGR